MGRKIAVVTVIQAGEQVQGWLYFAEMTAKHAECDPRCLQCPAEPMRRTHGKRTESTGQIARVLD